jgi:hypothetical protein
MKFDHIPEWLLPSIAAIEALQPFIVQRSEHKDGIVLSDSEALIIPTL